MKAYWLGIDEATAKLDCHSGGFYGLAAVVHAGVRTGPCESRLEQAAEAAKDDKAYAERVGDARGRVPERARLPGHLRRDGRGRLRDGEEAVYDGMVKRIDGLVAKGYANPRVRHRVPEAVPGPKTIDGGLTATAAPNKVVQVLPDDGGSGRRRRRGRGAELSPADFDDSKWRTAATYSATLSGQGLRENTVLWYRTTFQAPETLASSCTRGPACRQISGTPSRAFRDRCPLSSCQACCKGLFQIARVEALREPTVDRSEKLANPTCLPQRAIRT